MKTFKLSIAAATLVLSVGSVLGAQNVADGTYTFESTGNTSLNGSWVQFSGNDIVNWDLVDPSGTAQNLWTTNVFGDAYTNNFPALTPANSAVVASNTFASGGLTGPDAFSFTIASPANATASAASQVWYFNGGNNLNGGGQTVSSLYDGITYNDPPANDPIGTWNYTSATINGAPVPDAWSTFALLAGSLATLGTWRRSFRSSAALRK